MTPAQVAHIMPPLPKPLTLSRGDEDGAIQLGYTAEQMQAYARAAVEAALRDAPQQAEIDAITELNHAQWLALENVRTLAARNRKEEWAQHLLRWCTEAGNAARIMRADPSAPQQAGGWIMVPREPTYEMQSACLALVDLTQGDPDDSRYDDGRKITDSIYRAMLAAAPQSPATQGVHAAQPPMTNAASELGLREVLARKLTCCHRLTETEAKNVMDFLSRMSAAPQPPKEQE